jgi:hypothetical protein
MAKRDRTLPTSGTGAAERREVCASARAGDEPTPEEAAAADENELDEGVPEHYEEMTERGAHQRGEGRIA